MATSYGMFQEQGCVKKIVKTPSTCKTYKPFPLDNPDSKSTLPIYQKGLKTLKKERLIPESKTPLIKSCMMFSSSSSSYNSQFPPLEKHTDPQSKVVTKPYVYGPVTLSGQLEKPKPFKTVLNWQF